MQRPFVHGLTCEINQNVIEDTCVAITLPSSWEGWRGRARGREEGKKAGEKDVGREEVKGGDGGGCAGKKEFDIALRPQTPHILGTFRALPLLQ